MTIIGGALFSYIGLTIRQAMLTDVGDMVTNHHNDNHLENPNIEASIIQEQVKNSLYEFHNLDSEFNNSLSAMISTSDASMELDLLAIFMGTCSISWDENGIQPSAELFNPIKELAQKVQKVLQDLSIKLKHEVDFLLSIQTEKLTHHHQFISELKKSTLFRVIETGEVSRRLEFCAEVIDPIFVRSTDIVAMGNLVKKTHNQFRNSKPPQPLKGESILEDQESISIAQRKMQRFIRFFYAFYTLQAFVANTWHKSKHDRMAPNLSDAQYQTILELANLPANNLLRGKDVTNEFKIIDRVVSSEGIGLFYENWNKSYTAEWQRVLNAIKTLEDSNKPMSISDQMIARQTVIALKMIANNVYHQTSKTLNNTSEFFETFKTRFQTIQRDKLSLSNCIQIGYTGLDYSSESSTSQQFQQSQQDKQNQQNPPQYQYQY
ncbi:hypothetical protein NEHOM01_1821 [Nematocida homosporus]|uniref:uncharacterized protein n=1 Tax=Nematocida homosporus TaxID=1912981 RepID=UPI00221EB47E|nr:uncharacterized protein NEHOM01_1821 [Nematocida homosporus]KAI5186955.1 hypothetical protein NEHOM01_1821 [Nematocida homosporus]